MEPSGPEPGPRVLVVGADADRRRRLGDALRRRGYRPVEAATVADAVGLLAVGPFQAVIAEQRLRDGKALDLVDRLGPQPRPYMLVQGPWSGETMPPRPLGVDAHLPVALDDTQVAAHLLEVVPVRRRCALPTVHRGDHMALLFDGRTSLLDSAAAFLACGLTAGERALMLCRDRTELETARAHLGREGVDVERAERQGSLYLVTHDESYFLGGRFDPDVTAGFLHDLVHGAIEDGYLGLRAAGEPAWLTQTPEDRRLWGAFEALLQPHFNAGTLTALCAYPLSCCEPSLLVDALRTHPAVLDGRVVRDNCFCGAPPPEDDPGTRVLDWLKTLRRSIRRT